MNPEVIAQMKARNPKARLVRALEARKHALKIVEAKGAEQGLGNVPCKFARYGGFEIGYRSPSPEMQRVIRTYEANCGTSGAVRVPLPHGLDVWTTGRGAAKVMNIEWDDNGHVELVSFRGGDWEQPLTELACGWDAE